MKSSSNNENCLHYFHCYLYAQQLVWRFIHEIDPIDLTFIEIVFWKAPFQFTNRIWILSMVGQWMHPQRRLQLNWPMVFLAMVFTSVSKFNSSKPPPSPTPDFLYASPLKLNRQCDRISIENLRSTESKYRSCRLKEIWFHFNIIESLCRFFCKWGLSPFVWCWSYRFNFLKCNCNHKIRKWNNVVWRQSASSHSLSFIRFIHFIHRRKQIKNHAGNLTNLVVTRQKCRFKNSAH